MRALGVEAAYSVVERVGEERAFADPAGALADLAERVARTWGMTRWTSRWTSRGRAGAMSRGIDRVDVRE